jgi:hypothetical protein
VELLGSAPFLRVGLSRCRQRSRKQVAIIPMMVRSGNTIAIASAPGLDKADFPFRPLLLPLEDEPVPDGVPDDTVWEAV